MLFVFIVKDFFNHFSTITQFYQIAILLYLVFPRELEGAEPNGFNSRPRIELPLS